MHPDKTQSIRLACLVLKYNRQCVQSSLLEFVFLISKLDYHPLYEMVIKPLAQILQEDLDRLAKWSLEWDMEFNPSKCTAIHVTRSKSIVPSQYILYGHVLDSVSSSKNLGVTLNNHLTWNDHIQNTVTSANKTFGFLGRNIHTKDSSIREVAYKH